MLTLHFFEFREKNDYYYVNNLGKVWQIDCQASSSKSVTAFKHLYDQLVTNLEVNGVLCKPAMAPSVYVLVCKKASASGGLHPLTSNPHSLNSKYATVISRVKVNSHPFCVLRKLHVTCKTVIFAHD